MSKINAATNRENPTTKPRTATNTAAPTYIVTVWIKAHKTYPTGVLQLNGYLQNWKIREINLLDSWNED